jgi:hypothetical protein
LASVSFGDERLTKRALKLVECLAAQPQHSIPHAMGTWSDTKAAYRFLRNPNVTPVRILEPHRASTSARIASERVVFAVQDTTELNYTHLPATEGLGTIGSSKKLRGMLVHTTMAFTPERVPLGVLAQQTWIRPPEEFGLCASHANAAGKTTLIERSDTAGRARGRLPRTQRRRAAWHDRVMAWAARTDLDHRCLVDLRARGAIAIRDRIAVVERVSRHRRTSTPA